MAATFASLFGGNRENSDIVGIAVHAARSGYAVIAVKPGTKQPMCTLTDRQKVTADREAAHAARDRGHKNWEKIKHPCGRSHAITDDKAAQRIFKRLVDKHPDLNIGVELGASRCVVVDADTVDELRSFTELWAQREGVPELASAAPTVRSPGVMRVDTDEAGEKTDNWVHKGGGHYWFSLPEHIDLTGAGTSKAMKIGAHDIKASLMFRDQLVLVPPSVRPEGPYTMASDLQPAPAWLVDELLLHIAGHALRTEQQRERVSGDSPIEAWAAGALWEDIISRYEWTTSGRIENCGCENWTRPGDWSNPKSATAHEPGCLKFEDTSGFLHLWTDNPPEELKGRKDWSKLQFIAAMEHGSTDSDAIRETIRELGIAREQHGEPTVLTRKDIPSPRPRDDAGNDDRRTNASSESEASDEAPEEPSDQEEQEDDPERTSWWFRDLGPVLSGENPEPEPSVLRREDGQCLFYPGKVNGIIGPSESGKSWLAIEAVAQELRDGRPVLYMDFEDTAPGIVSRLRSLGVSDELMDPSAGLLAYIGPEESLHAIAYAEYAEVLRDRPWSLIVLDGVNAAMTQDGLDLLSNTDATKFFTKVTRPASLTGATVVTIDHVPKDTEKKTKGGIGAQAKRATVTGCLVFVKVDSPFGRGRSGTLELVVDKDRPGYVRGASNAGDVWSKVEVRAGDDGSLELELAVPEAVSKATGVTDIRADAMRVKVIEYLRTIKSPASGRQVSVSVTGTNSLILEALAWLSENGFVGRYANPKNKSSQSHIYLKDYPDSGPATLPHEGDDDPFEGA